LNLPEGQKVQVAVYPSNDLPSLRPPTPAEEDYARRLKSAKTIEEMHAIMETAPPSAEGEFDILQMINESRRLTGFRMPDPEQTDERFR
jgi:hypothetical protein